MGLYKLELDPKVMAAVEDIVRDPSFFYDSVDEFVTTAIRDKVLSMARRPSKEDR